MDRQTGGERWTMSRFLLSEYHIWALNKEQNTILSVTQLGNTCCSQPHCRDWHVPVAQPLSHEGASHGCPPSTHPECISQPGQIEPGSS